MASNGVARLHRSHVWGLDVSGTLTGAGGVGGLVLTSHHTPRAGGGTQVTTLAPLYDFNGNVLAYADVATSTITHRMEYDPFGQELSLDTLLPGDGAAEAPRFRFSTKYTDGETGLVYYGYRYYSPELGRWPSRDPIEERGGINLYGMVGNDAVNRFDYLGLAWRDLCPCKDERAGTLVRRALQPSDDDDWLDEIANALQALFAYHSFVILNDGTRLTYGGEADREDHWTAQTFPIMVRKGEKQTFMECMKKKMGALDPNDYHPFWNNCRIAESILSECGGCILFPR